MGPPVVLRFQCELDDVCVLAQSSAASRAVLVILCLQQQMNQSISFAVTQRPRHRITILERPSEVSVAEMTGLLLGCHEPVF